MLQDFSLHETIDISIFNQSIANTIACSIVPSFARRMNGFLPPASTTTKSPRWDPAATKPRYPFFVLINLRADRFGANASRNAFSFGVEIKYSLKPLTPTAVLHYEAPRRHLQNEQLDCRIDLSTV